MPETPEPEQDAALQKGQLFRLTITAEAEVTKAEDLEPEGQEA